jgi:NTP pyrophosphatase (non-canonical NTP hydrolase)
MEFSEFQLAAERTDQAPRGQVDDLKSMMIPLLGLVGESGSLLTEYKKYLRDGDAYKLFHERISEELGDILWYLANIATKSGLDLEQIAQRNLSKTLDRWHEQTSPLFGPKLFDDGLPEFEQFPRKFQLKVSTIRSSDGKDRVQLFYEGRRFGDQLGDNAYEDDGYRLHDVFHLSYLAILGWSPVLRKLFNCKRKSNRETDENEDGGRANVIDEAISALVFVEAKKHSFFANVNSVEYQVLRTIKDLTAHLEVRRCSAKQWERAILEGFRIWRILRTNGNGTIVGDLIASTIDFVPDEVQN